MEKACYVDDKYAASAVFIVYYICIKGYPWAHAKVAGILQY